MFKDENRHYSLRKLSVGLASVLIGISFASTTGDSVKADTVNGAQTVVKGNDAAIKTDTKSAPEGQSQTPEAVKKDSGAITQDSKQYTVNAKVKRQNATIRGDNTAGDKALNANNSSVVLEDSSAKGDSLANKNNALKAKAETAKKAVAAAFHPDSSETTLNLKNAKFVNPKTLNENKTEAVVKADPARGIDPVKFASNGGFDPAIWGTMDTSKWQLDNDGNITGYTGDMSHIIIPNASDFAKVGKSYQQIGISSYEMRQLGDKANSKADTLAISLTDNGKVEASNTNWNGTFINTLLKQANLEGLDTGNITDMSTMFDSARRLTSLDVSNWNTSNVTDMSHMFDNISSLANLDVSNWKTGNVTDMNSMFSDASGLTNLNVSKWDTSKVTNMANMFSDASGLTSLDVSKWNTSKVTNMGAMFYNIRGLTSLDVSNWNTSNVTDMGGMFSGTSGLTSLDVSKWNTSKVTNMGAMFYNTRGLTNLNVSKWDTSKVTDMSLMFYDARRLTSLDVSNWNTGGVTNMDYMFYNTRGLTNLNVSKWDTSKVIDMSAMFAGTSSLTDLDVSNWDASKVTDMSYMFTGAYSLMSLDVSKWDTGKVTDMHNMFYEDSDLALIVNGDKFADYLVENNFANSKINSDVKSVTTDNAKLLQLLTTDRQHDSATRTIVFTFPANYSPDLTKYHLIKVGSTYQIKQSADYDKPYLQGTVLINATSDIAEHHIDTTKQNKLSDTWQPNYNKLVLAHKNSDGSVSFDTIRLPKVIGYKAIVKTVANPINPASALFAVSFMAMPKPATPAINDIQPDETVTPTTPEATEVAKPIETEPKVTISATPKAIDLSNDTIATTLKTIDLSDDIVVATTPDVSTWQVADEPSQDTYCVSNGKYTVELPHISNAQLHVIANDSTKDSILFTYMGQNAQYVFNIKFVDGHYLLTTYEIKSGKLVKLIDYNFIKSSKMIDVILDWLQFK